MGKITLVTGGTRSGKSFFAVQQALQYDGRRFFVATATPFDDEMRQRIEKHKAEREGLFETVEAPYELSQTLVALDVQQPSVILVDCVTIWLNNLLYRYNENTAAVDSEVEKLVSSLPTLACDCIFVTNEVGMGIVPENALARLFRDVAGVVNRKIGEAADSVYLSVCGIQMKIK